MTEDYSSLEHPLLLHRCNNEPSNLQSTARDSCPTLRSSASIAPKQLPTRRGVRHQPSSAHGSHASPEVVADVPLSIAGRNSRRIPPRRESRPGAHSDGTPHSESWLSVDLAGHRHREQLPCRHVHLQSRRSRTAARHDHRAVQRSVLSDSAPRPPSCCVSRVRRTDFADFSSRTSRQTSPSSPTSLFG